jgi:hypothetical protein
MKKIVISLFLLATMILIGGCLGWKAEEGYKIETDFIEKQGYISLAITPFGFVKDDYSLVIIDKSGDAIGTNYLLKEHFARGEIIQGEITREIKMTNLPYRMPKGTRFFLLVKKEGEPEPIFRKELEFAGPKLAVISLEGSEYRQATETKNRTIESLCINLENSGDMPAWVSSAELTDPEIFVSSDEPWWPEEEEPWWPSEANVLKDKGKHSAISGEPWWSSKVNSTVKLKLGKPVIIMPNEKESLLFTSIRDSYGNKIGLTYGEHPLSIDLFDGGGTLVGTIQTIWEITPSTAPVPVGPVALPCGGWIKLISSLLGACCII